MATQVQMQGTLGSQALAIAVIGPEPNRRGSVATVLAGLQAGMVREFNTYPELDNISSLLDQSFDVLIVDLDSNPEYALDLVESLCGRSTATVMVYSAHANPDLLVRCMRAGAREFLTQPFAPETVAEALIRASARRAPGSKKAIGKLLVFLGAKGGSGVTTLACNFAVSLASETKASTLLIDFHLPLGDAALNLGINAQYSTVNALQDSTRLDSNFLSKLLTKHTSGLSVLAAPGKFSPVPSSQEAVDKLLQVARQDFDYVVVDAGSRLDLAGTSLFEEATTIYLVTQVGIPELRNSNRLITEFFAKSGSRLEIVVNRYAARALGVDDEHIAKALTKPAKWKVPNDYATTQRTQNTATPLSLEDSPISRVLKQMARAASDLPPSTEKKKRFGIFG